VGSPEGLDKTWICRYYAPLSDEGGAMSKPTVRQLEFLSARGIIAPPTRAACRSVIAYINSSNGAKDFRQRISLVRENQNALVGKPVRVASDNDRIGVVQWVGCQYAVLAEVRGAEGLATYPIVAMVKFEDRGSKLIPVPMLTKI